MENKSSTAPQIPEIQEKKLHSLSASSMFPKLSKELDKKENWPWFLYWKLTPIELEEQVSKYDTLSINKSYKGQATLLYSAMLGLVLILGYMNWAGADLSSSIGSIVIYAPFIIFTYLGHRWAMIGLMVLETIDRILQFGTGINGMIIFIWWALFVSLVYKAYQVEIEKKKRILLSNNV